MSEAFVMKRSRHVLHNKMQFLQTESVSGAQLCKLRGMRCNQAMYGLFVHHSGHAAGIVCISCMSDAKVLGIHKGSQCVYHRM
jgi:hypothetical protein